MKKRVAIVTGASSGIGEATAELLANSGYKVYGTSRKADQVTNRPYKMIALDVTSEASVAAALKQVIDIEGQIDLLVNNAGFGVAPGGAEESSIEQTQRIFDTNFFGLVRMTRAVLPYMRKQGAGRIINIGSILGLIPAPYMATYAATKHAVEGYSESIDHELRTQGIRVSVIEPAYTNTQFESNTQELDSKLAEYATARKALAKLIKISVAAGDDPGVVAEVVLKAASAKNPKLRYAAGKLARRLSLLRRFAPAALVDMGIRKEMKLDSLDSIASQA
ncbi:MULTISPECIES: oxidoreductase [Methylovorus]|uniref:Short-chain dehydrogenase/reductase SDR n=1 Tax=Methylovorus glucosotrophus (strain SIP3-4) TaxID=582744 RepID=C6XDG3_METGS|nr:MULTISPECIES: oxidoreductase [Methylovorus]ACT50588.1 short-chain dehydrogenase/reductase SDR [Methylovorus glucosotrophus SIP3-4]ADQ84575.1 short-chain dehydrogenase/reductase SDR [Methylovorus sp. MP688]